MYGDVELSPEVLKDLAEVFLGLPSAPESQTEQACRLQQPWPGHQGLGKDVFPDYLGFEQARSGRLPELVGSAWRPLSKQYSGQGGEELGEPGQHSRGWNLRTSAPGTPEASLEVTDLEHVKAPQRQEAHPCATTRQKRQSARLRAATGACSSSGKDLAHQAAAMDSDGGADLAEVSAPTDPKMRKLRLKNKNAQKRFRDRQKAKLQDCQERIDELEQQLHAAKSQRPAKSTDSSGLGSEGKGQWTQGLRELLGDKPEMRISVGAQPGTVTVEQVAKWTWQKHGQLWKEYVNAVGPLVTQVEETSLPAAMKELTILVDEIVLLCACMGAASPANMRKFHCLCMDVESPAEAPANLWAEIASRLELSDAQQQAASAAYQEYLSRIQALMQERCQLAAWLRPTVSGQAQQAQVSREHLAAVDLVAQLARNLREEDHALLKLSNHWYCQVVSPLQVAKCMLMAVPYTPDVVSIMRYASSTMYLACPDHDAAMSLPDFAPCYTSTLLL